MNYIIHLTQRCNLRCKYCYENKGNKEISFDNIQKIIDNEIKEKRECVNITFYGGEPLLKKDLIYNTVDYIKSKKCKTKFYFGITTNGTLLDEQFIKYMKNNNFINIAYSFDGLAETQNINRITIDGKGTFDVVENNAKKLLESDKEVVAMVVVTKNNINNLKENVEYLMAIGFEKINLLFDYLQDWKAEDLEIIREQFSNVAEIYYNKILNEEDVDIFIFDEKIKTHIKEEYNCNEECKLGIKSINVGSDGNFYPCMQFVGDEKYVIGNCDKGIDFEARKKLIEQSCSEKDICKECLVKKRCKHTCACRNYLTTKDINGLSPLNCEFERIIIEISDKLAEKLYKQNSKLFIQKYYNENYNTVRQIINNKKRGNLYGNKKYKKM